MLSYYSMFDYTELPQALNDHQLTDFYLEAREVTPCGLDQILSLAAAENLFLVMVLQTCPELRHACREWYHRRLHPAFATIRLDESVLVASDPAMHGWHTCISFILSRL